jgi:hypothetical protein
VSLSRLPHHDLSGDILLGWGGASTSPVNSRVAASLRFARVLAHGSAVSLDLPVAVEVLRAHASRAGLLDSPRGDRQQLLLQLVGFPSVGPAVAQEIPLGFRSASSVDPNARSKARVRFGLQGELGVHVMHSVPT